MILLALYGEGLYDSTPLFNIGYVFGIGLYATESEEPFVAAINEPTSAVKVRVYSVKDIDDITSLSKADITVDESYTPKVVRVLLNKSFHDAYMYVSDKKLPPNATFIESGDWGFYCDIQMEKK